MTDIQHIDVDSDEYEDAPVPLRDHVKKLQKALTERTTERDSYRAQVHESALGDVLAGFRNPAKVKTDLLGSGVDPLDNEAVQTWLQENGGDYAQGEAPATPAGDQAEQQQTEVPDYGRVNGIQQIGTPSGSDLSDVVANPPAEIAGDPTALRNWFIKQGV